MNNLTYKLFNRQRRQNRIRSQIKGSDDRPRLSVSISNYHVSAQLIDDSADKTIASVTTVGKKVEGSLNDKASWVGLEVAKAAKKAKISKVVLDRRGRKYHGRVKSLAEAARKEGLEF